MRVARIVVSRLAWAIATCWDLIVVLRAAGALLRIEAWSHDSSQMQRPSLVERGVLVSRLPFSRLSAYSGEETVHPRRVHVSKPCHQVRAMQRDQRDIRSKSKSPEHNAVMSTADANSAQPCLRRSGVDFSSSNHTASDATRASTQ